MRSQTHQRGRLSLAAIVVLSLLPQILAADDTAGAALAPACFTCHGIDGRNAGAIPALAGRTETDLSEMLTGFADGSRPGTIMPRLVSGYTPEELAALAAYFAKVTP
jgi:sulfide dehydrogenase cytochrome subunit